MTLSRTNGRLKKYKSIWIPRAARTWRAMREYRMGFSLPLAGLLRAVLQSKPGTGMHGDSGRKRILVVRLDAMGDLVMTSPIFRELRLHYPDAVITAVVQISNRNLLETNPYINRILHPPAVHPSRILRGSRRGYAILRLYADYLRSETFDVALSPRLGPDYYGADLLLKLVAAPVSLRYDDTSQRGPARTINNYIFRKMVNLPKPEAQHEMLSSAAIVRRITGESLNSRPQIFLTPEDRAFAECITTSGKRKATLVCLAFGAQAGKRSWPRERWSKVVEKLSEERRVFVLLVCSRAERHEGECLRGMLGVSSLVVSEASLRQAAACIEACDLFIGTDSGLAHMAAAVGCPSVIVSPHPLNGDPHHGNSPTRFRPWSEHARVLQPAAGLKPCEAGCDAMEPHCILQVSPEQVAGACNELLALIQVA